ncbi:MAG: SRPBCC family protein [Oscillochloridaceae bacterium umkhey_bin13]
MLTYPGASVSALIAAPIEAVWAQVSDPHNHPRLAGSGEVQAIEVLGGVMGPGTVFQSQQQMRGLSYVTANRTVLWEPPARFAWRVGFSFAPGVAQVWGFLLTAEEGGTWVENGVALPYPLPTKPPFDRLHAEIGRREGSVIAPTLVNLAAALGAPPPVHMVERHTAPEALADLLPPPLIQAALIAGGAAVIWSLLRGSRRR